jgi:hypothetical protein
MLNADQIGTGRQAGPVPSVLGFLLVFDDSIHNGYLGDTLERLTCR